MVFVMNLLRYVGICDFWDVNFFCLRLVVREKEIESYLSIISFGFIRNIFIFKDF